MTATLPPVSAALSLFRANRLLSVALERRLGAATGLSSAAGEVMLRLGATSSGSLGMSELVFATCISNSGVTRIVERLERRGLLVRRISSKDRRLTLVDLTEAGRELMWKLLATFDECAQQDFVRFLGPEDTQDLAEKLERLVAGLWGNESGRWPRLKPPSIAAARTSAHQAKGRRAEASARDGERAHGRGPSAPQEREGRGGSVATVQAPRRTFTTEAGSRGSFADLSPPTQMCAPTNGSRPPRIP